MVHKAGGLTCRAPRPGHSAGRRGPERPRTLLLGPGPASTRALALPGGERSAWLSAAQGGSAGQDGGSAAASLPLAARGVYKLGPRPSSRPVPASALPRRPSAPGTPPAPRARATRQPSGSELASRDPQPSTPNNLGAPSRCARGGGQGGVSLPADSAGGLIKGSLAPGFLGSTPRATAPRVAGATFALLPQTQGRSAPWGPWAGSEPQPRGQ